MSLPQPKFPVLSWRSCLPSSEPLPPRFGGSRHRLHTTSGRAALACALRHMAAAHGSAVGVPTYHCPTMIAPVVMAGLRPQFYPITDEGLPRLGALLDSQGKSLVQALLVPHYFGVPRNLEPVQQWCRMHGVLLIEDCAHTYFGMAGDRPVGCWGDYAIASISKFKPVPEAGILLLEPKPDQAIELSSTAWLHELKAAFTVIERALSFGRLAGLGVLYRATMGLRKLLKREHRVITDITQPIIPSSQTIGTNNEQAIAYCDMDRSFRHPSRVARLLATCLPEGPIVAARRRNYQRFLQAFGALDGATPLSQHDMRDGAPYVFPLLVRDEDRAHHLYHHLRISGYAVFRWDTLWPGTPSLAGDAGQLWSHRIIQFLCHQSLGEADIERTVREVQRLLNPSPASTPDPRHAPA